MELAIIYLFIYCLLSSIHIIVLKHKLGELYSEVKDIKRWIKDNDENR